MTLQLKVGRVEGKEYLFNFPSFFFLSEYIESTPI